MNHFSLQLPSMTGRALAAMVMLLCSQGVLAAENDGQISRQDWAGVWHTEEPGFRVRVTLDGDSFRVQSLQPATLKWQSRPGPIENDTATVGVEFQGVKARVMVQLTDPGTAMVRTLSCEPDYHVLCSLARNQQARFLKAQPE